MDFNVSKEDGDLIAKIAQRAVRRAHALGRYDYTEMHLAMDLTAAHQHAPLDLAGLLAADDGSFGHDVFGIHKHIDRSTGRMDLGFTPRFTIQCGRLDYQLTADELRQKYSPDDERDGEHPSFSKWDWCQLVAQRVTVSGYWAWVAEKLEKEFERSLRS